MKAPPIRPGGTSGGERLGWDVPINHWAGMCMFKWLSRLFRGRPAKVKKAPAGPRKAAAAELSDAAAEMGEAAAAMKQAAVHMNAAVAGPAQAPVPAPTPTPAKAAAETAETKPPKPSREEIIRQAMEVRRDKARVIEDLPAKDRQRLRALAEKMMLGTDPKPPADGTPRRKPH